MPQTIKGDFNLRNRIILFTHVDNYGLGIVGMHRDFPSRRVFNKEDAIPGIHQKLSAKVSNQGGKSPVGIAKVLGHLLSRSAVNVIHPECFVLFVRH